MSKKILFVDDDPKVLTAIERQFEDNFELACALGPEAGLEEIDSNGPFAVVISDMQMPDMSGIELLTEVKSKAPETVRMMLTGFADLTSTIDAINRGNIFRFLSKPCPYDILELAIKDGIRQYELQEAEKELVEGTLMGSVKVLADVLGLVNPVAFGRASRVKRIAVAIARNINMPNLWEIEIASMLSAIGCVTLSESVLEKLANDGVLTESERLAFERHPEIGKGLLENIPRLGNVANIVQYQEKQFDGGGVPTDKVNGKGIPLGARILKVALDFDTEENRCDVPFDALSSLKANSNHYDPAVLFALESILSDLFDTGIESIDVSELRIGKILAANVFSTADHMLVAKGQEVTRSTINFLVNYADRNELLLPLRIYNTNG